MVRLRLHNTKDSFLGIAYVQTNAISCLSIYPVCISQSNPLFTFVLLAIGF